MPELDADIAEMVAALQQARLAMEAELGGLAAARFMDRDRLARVEELARGFEEQANALAEASASRSAAQTLVDEASDLFDYFRGIEERVETIIDASLD